MTKPWLSGERTDLTVIVAVSVICTGQFPVQPAGSHASKVCPTPGGV